MMEFQCLTSNEIVTMILVCWAVGFVAGVLTGAALKGDR